MLNPTLLKAATNIMDNGSPNQFIITARFINSDSGSKFSFAPLQIDEIVIDKDFIPNFADDIRMTWMISPKDYALLQDQGQSLLCVLTITYVTKFGVTVLKPTPIQKQYHVLLNDPRDIRTAIPDIQHYTEPSQKITVQLVEPTVYQLRHTRVNSVYQNVTLTQAIHAITQSLNIPKIQMVPLDNTHSYDHIDISSYQGIDSVYGYLHSKCGLYTKGANSYLADGVMYIYPPFETSPTYDKTVVFYQVNTNLFTGAHIYHKVDGKTTSIVINSQPESYDLSVAGAENVGTGFVFTRASRLTDGFTTATRQGAEVTQNPALSIILNAARTIVKDLNNIFHIKATDNPFPQMSKLVSHQASLMEVIWMHADPFQLDPGHAVSYFYDHNETMVKKTGIVEKASYRIVRGQKMGSKDMFSAVGTLSLRLSVNTSQVLGASSSPSTSVAPVTAIQAPPVANPFMASVTNI